MDKFVLNVPAVAVVVTEPDFLRFMMCNNYTTSEFNGSTH